MTYFGIVGYLAPLPSFQSYLAELPPGESSVLNNATYIFYFQDQYAIQAGACAVLTVIAIWAFINPHRGMAKLDRLLKRVGIDE